MMDKKQYIKDASDFIDYFAKLILAKLILKDGKLILINGISITLSLWLQAKLFFVVLLTKQTPSPSFLGQAPAQRALISACAPAKSHL